MTALYVPDIPADADTLTAALAYAKAGWYVLPVKRGSKHPGSVVGNRWQTQSSRDPKVITALFAGTDNFRTATHDLDKTVRRLGQMAADDRFSRHRDTLSQMNRGDLIRVRDALNDVIGQLGGGDA